MKAKERNVLIAASYEAGDKVPAIAARHGLSEGTVRNIMQGAGARREALRATSRGAILAALERGMKAKHVAEVAGVSVDWVRKVRAQSALSKACAPMSKTQ